MLLQNEMTNLGKHEQKELSGAQFWKRELYARYYVHHCLAHIIQVIDDQSFYLLWCQSHVKSVAHGAGKLHVVHFPI